jgi:hypothetical protein
MVSFLQATATVAATSIAHNIIGFVYLFDCLQSNKNLPTFNQDFSRTYS